MSRALISWFSVGGFTLWAVGTGLVTGCDKSDSVPPASASATAAVAQAPSLAITSGPAAALPSGAVAVSAGAPTAELPAGSDKIPVAREPRPTTVSSAATPPLTAPTVRPTLAASSAPPAAPPAATEAPAIVGAPCKATTFKFPSVADACKRGGVKQAKAMMKTLVNRAKANGQVMKCTSCHSDSKTYALKSNANADFKALLALPPG